MDFLANHYLTYLIFLVVVWAAALLFRYRQNKLNQVGGQISLPKSLWLAYTVSTWFFLPFFVLFHQSAQAIETIVLWHLASFWFRGIIELVMIYKFFNWSPKYGIGHDVFHLLLLGFLIVRHNENIDSFTAYFLAGLVVSLCFETLFALLFFKIRGAEKHKVYFASDSPEWRGVNRLTTLANIVCFSLLGLMVINV